MHSGQSNLYFDLALRALPTIIILSLAFVAASDKKTRERWAEVLYQVGAVRPEQREDPKVQRSVRLPFFIVALLLLIWPIRHYLYANRTINITVTDLHAPSETSSLHEKESNPDATPGATPGGAIGTSTPAAPGVPPVAAMPGSATPAPGKIGLHERASP
ncbi:MAG: hypothetical protein M3347_15780 [Armatimonadota bacterium]|nr:hypothetical protein [Armatimonadota bacterium]